MRTFLLLLVTLFLASFGAEASTYYVSQSTANGYAVGNDSNNGLAKSTPFLTVGKANSAASNGDTIILNDGTYLTTDGPNAAASLVISKSLTWLAETPLGAAIRGTNTTNILNINPGSSTTVVLGGIVVDCQNTTSRGINISDTAFTPTVILNGTKVLNNTGYGVYCTEPTMNLFVTNATVTASAVVSGGGIFNITTTAGDTVVDGLTLSLTAASTTIYGVRIESTDGDGSTAHVTRVTGTVTTGGSSAGTYGVLVKNIANALVENCTITVTSPSTTTSCRGIQITSSGFQCDGGTIRSNSISFSSVVGYGIAIGNSATSATDNKCNNGSIYCNTVTGLGNQSASPHGIAIGPDTNCVVFRNTVINFYVGVLASKMLDGAVYDNLILQPYGRILYSKGSNGTKFLNNTIVFTNGFAGIPFYATNHADDQTYSTNVIYQNNISLSPLNSQVFVTVAPLNAGWSQSQASFANNLYYSSGTAAANPWSYQGTGYSTLANWIASGNDSGSIASDPKFTSTSNFALLWISPAINAGASTGGVVAFDFLGNPIVGTPDIGAYEYQAIPSPIFVGGRIIGIR